MSRNAVEGLLLAVLVAVGCLIVLRMVHAGEAPLWLWALVAVLALALLSVLLGMA